MSEQEEGDLVAGELAADVRITPTVNGPYIVEGPVEIGGTVHMNAVLCRCGRSGAKPFCDGTHLRTAWREDEAWVESDEGEEG